MQARDLEFRSGGVRLRYRDEGAGEPLVLVHGWTLDLDTWQPQAEELAARMRILRHDRRGFGLSGGEPSPAADVVDLRALLDHAGLPRAALLGASQGARVALAFALAHPARVTALVLDGPPDEAGDGADEEELPLEAYRELAEREGVEAFRRAWRGHAFTRLYAAGAAERALLERVLARFPARDLAAAAQRARPAGRAALRRIACPVLVINGALDSPARLAAGEAIAQLVPDAERVVLPGAGHLPNLDAARAYNRAVAEFLCRRLRAAA